MHLSSVLKKKFTAQHRALYCYLLLSLWLLFLLIVMYKFMETEDATLTIFKNSISDQTTRSFPYNLHSDIKTQRVLRMCNLPLSIKTITEGKVKDTFHLEGVLMLIRHGDRGPLTHVRGISTINCATNSHPMFNAYEAYMDNMTGTSQLAQLLGPFHGFPLLPQKTCSLGQLTHVGVSQLLATGEALRAVYADRLGIFNNTVSDDIVVYSTKYRRTLQSALAFLYAFLTPDLMHHVALKETPSLQFCFEDCVCPMSDVYLKKFSNEKANHLYLHPAVLKLIKITSVIVYEVFEKNQASDPYSLRDAILAYLCHGARLPCSDKSVCVHTEQVTGLLSYIEWEARQYSRSSTLKRACILRAYGMIKNIVSYLVRIISEKKPKLVIYSGHDKTILYLATALGIAADTTYLAQYASRFIIEVYRNVSRDVIALSNVVGSDYYFRLLFNGKDMTNRVQFCKGVVTISYKRTYQSIFLCPIHTIIQFLHNDYFSLFNASNFKDSCILHSK